MITVLLLSWATTGFKYMRLTGHPARQCDHAAGFIVKNGAFAFFRPLVMSGQPEIILCIFQLIGIINTIPCSGSLNHAAEYSPLQPDLDISNRTTTMPFVHALLWR